MTDQIPDPVYKAERSFEQGHGLPTISTDLDSVRAYQFEVHFTVPGGILEEQPQALTLAAKKVTGADFTIEPVAVNRVNDKVFYPGRPTPGDVVITFDNIYLKRVATDLWNYFTTIYDPISGEMEKNTTPGGGGGIGAFKAERMEIVQLDNAMNPHATIDLYGVWPTKWSAAEFNYSTNDFHSIDVTFKYDFMSQYNY